MYESVVRLGDRLAALVDGLDPDAVSGPAAGELVTAFQRVERLAAAGITLLARRVADTHHPDRTGTRSAAEALARRAGTSVGQARDTLETSARLPDLPNVEAAVRRGQLSPVQAAAISNAAAADPGSEQRLLDLASRASVPELREECARVRAAADPNPDATNQRLHNTRRLRRYPDAEGGWNLTARGTPQAGAILNTALDPIIDRILQTARQEGRREPYEAYAFDALLTLAQQTTGGDRAATGAPDPAEPTANTADAAVAGTGIMGGDPPPAEAAADGPAKPAPTPVPAAASRPPSRVNPRYRALLRVDLQALRRGTVEAGELCEITGVGPIPVTRARELLGDAVLHLVITRGVDVLNVTHLGRGPTAAQRIALAWTSPGCTVERCPRTRTEYDHRHDWQHTRHTRLDELDPLCEFHHDLKTRLGWALVPGTGKRALVPPDDPRHPRHQAASPHRRAARAQLARPRPARNGDRRPAGRDRATGRDGPSPKDATAAPDPNRAGRRPAAPAQKARPAPPSTPLSEPSADRPP